MIFGSIESDQDETRAYFNKGLDITNPKGVNIVEVARQIYNGGNPGCFEAIGLQLPIGAKFRFGPNMPWSNIPSNGMMNFTALYGAKAITNYLEIDLSGSEGGDAFNVYFAMN